jgi:transcriptional regulator GlxA family with amidase domain
MSEQIIHSSSDISKMAFVLLPRFNMMTLTTTIDPMRIANYLSSDPLYEWAYLSPEASDLSASNGMVLPCEPLANHREVFDSVFVLGSWGSERYVHPELFSWLRLQERKGAMICGMEIGAYVVARAGLLSGRQATTHWSHMAGFAEQFPNSHLREQLFTVDGKIMTCAGGTAGIDLALFLISQKHGEHLTREVADQILHHPMRPADFSQRHALGSTADRLHPEVEAAIKLMEENISDPLSVPEIARSIGLSQRKLERLFKRHMGCSVVQLGQLLRLQYARVLLTTTRMSIRDVSVASGFNSMSYFSQAFTRCFGRNPSEYRHAWPEREANPSWLGTVFSFTGPSRKIADALKKSHAQALD